MLVGLGLVLCAGFFLCALITGPFNEVIIRPFEVVAVLLVSTIVAYFGVMLIQDAESN